MSSPTEQTLELDLPSGRTARVTGTVGCGIDCVVAVGCDGGVMLGAGKARVFYYAQPCDMRKQMDGLSTLVRSELERNPQDGDLYLFRNRRKDMIKILFYDQGGYCLLAKRLDKGTFSIELDAEEGVAHIELGANELAALLSEARIVQKSMRAA